MDCVLGYHRNPLTCGVAKFNAILAQRCGVPFLGVFDDAAVAYRSPMLSLKLSELPSHELPRLERWLAAAVASETRLRVFVHEFSETALEGRLIREAAAVYCGNAELAARLSALREDVREAWCPGTLLDARRFEPTEVSVLSFGMAHKVRSDHYARLHALLDRTGRSHCLYLSMALHEGSTFDDAFGQPFEELRRIFGDRVRFLGYLSDAAVVNHLAETTFFAAFFDAGVRANNTSVNAAMQHGAVVITNLDRYSPSGLVHMETVVDIARCEALPMDPGTLRGIGERARETARQALGWEALIARVRDFEGA